MMEILSFECGPLYTNTYLVGDMASGTAVLIDCPPDTLPVLRGDERASKYRIETILITHGHWDHTGGAQEVKKAFGSKVLVHPDDEDPLRNPGSLIGNLPSNIHACEPDGHVTGGDTVGSGPLTFHVLFVPGHTRGHVAFYHEEESALFAGDVLFQGSIGRTDLPGGNYDTLMEAIREKFLPLPDETKVYPGHGPATTIGLEKRTNPFIIDYLAHFT